jgi:outer membrane lipopolysaccharide assembly protein LptE/RlpB
MTRILAIILLLFATPMLASCTAELEVASYAQIENPTKRILAPAGIGKNITKFLKGYFRKNGWVVVVETKTRNETRSFGGDRSVSETFKPLKH